MILGEYSRQETEDRIMADSSKMPKVAKRFQDLIVWRRSHEFVLSVYRITKEFPEYELFGLVSQMRRAAVSIPANISEGFKRKGRPIN